MFHQTSAEAFVYHILRNLRKSVLEVTMMETVRSVSYQGCHNNKLCGGVQTNVVVTPLRKAALYEQRKTNLGNQNFRRRIIT